MSQWMLILGPKYLPPTGCSTGLFQCEEEEEEAEWWGSLHHSYNDVALQMGWTKAGHSFWSDSEPEADRTHPE